MDTLLKIKEVVLYYKELKNKKNMGISITLSDVEKIPMKIKKKTK